MSHADPVVMLSSFRQLHGSARPADETDVATKDLNVCGIKNSVHTLVDLMFHTSAARISLKKMTQ